MKSTSTAALALLSLLFISSTGKALQLDLCQNDLCLIDLAKSEPLRENSDPSRPPRYEPPSRPEEPPPRNEPRPEPDRPPRYEPTPTPEPDRPPRYEPTPTPEPDRPPRYEPTPDPSPIYPTPPYDPAPYDPPQYDPPPYYPTPDPVYPEPGIPDSPPLIDVDINKVISNSSIELMALSELGYYLNGTFALNEIEIELTQLTTTVSIESLINGESWDQTDVKGYKQERKIIKTGYLNLLLDPRLQTLHLKLKGSAKIHRVKFNLRRL